MSLHIDMSNSPFSDAHLDASLSSGPPTGSSSTTFCSSDMAPYSASMSPFSYPAGDANMLTPASSAASPPQHRRSKSSASYDGPEELQQPTPPGSSKMFFNSFESSPTLGINPQVTESHFEMANYIHASPETEVVPYFGSYSVSVPEGPESSDHRLSRFSSFASNGLADPMQLVNDHNQHYSQMVPDLASPGPTLFRPARGSIIEDLKASPGMTHHQLSYFPPDGLSSDLPTPPIKRERAQSRPNNRVRKASKRREMSRSVSASNLSLGGPVPSPLATPSTVMPPKSREPTLTFSDKASEEDHALLEFRKQNSDGKGKGMWDSITKFYGQKYDAKVQRAALQMKLSRAVCKHGIWPEHEIKRLIEATQYDDEHRYARIIARMKEMGGGQVWDWKPPHIEAQLVKLGMEEPVLDEKSKTRRKNRMAQRKRSAAQAHPYLTQNGNGTVVDWLSMPARPHPSMMSHPFGRGSISGYELGGAGSSGDDYVTGAPPTCVDQHFYPSDQEDGVLDDIHRKYGVAESPEPDFGNNRLGISFPAQDAASAAGRDDDVAQQNRRVALQACESLMPQYVSGLPQLKV